ncbi:hypothetical protein MKZ08_16030 [Viridibacillus sp. FSL R5-0477]|uniref:hypothetical protein n=1 Tax=Viridibacillus TaxID=496496 RepID=UPI0004AF01E2|nr:MULTISPECIES: hypothetical protein [Viridibacillus]
MLSLWIASWIVSFWLGIKGVKSKESGPLKYFGMSTISIVVLGCLLIIVLVGIRGFGA